MTWWTTVPGLTPVAAYDAGRVSGAQLLDGVGSNHITATATLVTADFIRKNIKGNNAPMTIATPIPVPVTGVIAGFWRVDTHATPTVLLAKTAGGGGDYMLHLSANGNGWYATANGVGMQYGGGSTTWDADHFVAMVTRGTDSILYIDGVQVGTALSSIYTSISSLLDSRCMPLGYGLAQPPRQTYRRLKRQSSWS